MKSAHTVHAWSRGGAIVKSESSEVYGAWYKEHWPIKFEYYMYFVNADMQANACFLMTTYCLSEHCCINVCRMSWVRVRFSGTMAWLTHAHTESLCVSVFLWLSNTHTHTGTDRVWLKHFYLASIFSASMVVCLIIACPHCTVFDIHLI